MRRWRSRCSDELRCDCLPNINDLLMTSNSREREREKRIDWRWIVISHTKLPTSKGLKNESEIPCVSYTTNYYRWLYLGSWQVQIRSTESPRSDHYIHGTSSHQKPQTSARRDSEVRSRHLLGTRESGMNYVSISTPSFLWGGNRSNKQDGGERQERVESASVSSCTREHRLTHSYDRNRRV
jgi:hypothetical protein